MASSGTGTFTYDVTDPASIGGSGTFTYDVTTSGNFSGTGVFSYDVTSPVLPSLVWGVPIVKGVTSSGGGGGGTTPPPPDGTPLADVLTDSF